MKEKYIEVYLKNKDDYRSEFHYQRLSSNLGDYIWGECKNFHPKEDFEIRIACKEEFTEKEKEEFVSMIREYYGLDIREAEIITNRVRLLQLFCLSLGLIFLILHQCFLFVDILNEFILIIGWVFIWEGIYSLFFSGIKYRYYTQKLKKLTNCKICFIPKK